MVPREVSGNNESLSYVSKVFMYLKFLYTFKLANTHVFRHMLKITALLKCHRSGSSQGPATSLY